MSPHGVKPGTTTHARTNTSGISRRAVPRPGDVVASRASARADLYEISVVPADTQTVAGRYPEAIAHVRELARRLRVDGWYTSDHTHYVPIAVCRDKASL